MKERIRALHFIPTRYFTRPLYGGLAYTPGCPSRAYITNWTLLSSGRRQWGWPGDKYVSGLNGPRVSEGRIDCAKSGDRHRLSKNRTKRVAPRTNGWSYKNNKRLWAPGGDEILFRRTYCTDAVFHTRLPNNKCMQDFYDEEYNAAAFQIDVGGSKRCAGCNHRLH